MTLTGVWDVLFCVVLAGRKSHRRMAHRFECARNLLLRLMQEALHAP
jgi:hypothetical protein